MSDHDQNAERVFETARSGGVAIFGTDVGYAIVGHTGPAIERIFTLKKRSYDKPCGCFGSWDMFQSMIEFGDQAAKLVDAVVNRHDLPFSIVDTYRPEHPVITNADPFVIQHATKNGTIDLLMNAGPVHSGIARRVLEHGVGVFGSSANMSLTGSKFDFTDVEPELRDHVDYVLDSGKTKYSHPKGSGSTIIDLRTFTTLREGICYERIVEIAATEIGIDIKPLQA